MDETCEPVGDSPAGDGATCRSWGTIRAGNLFSAAHPAGRLGKIVQFPLVRLLVASVLFIVYAWRNGQIVPILPRVKSGGLGG